MIGLGLLVVLVAGVAVGGWVWYGKQKPQTQTAVVEPTIAPTPVVTGSLSTSDCDQVSSQGLCFQRMIALVDVRDTLDPSGNPLIPGEEGRLMFSKGYCGLVNIEIVRQRGLFDEVHFKRVSECESAK